MNILKVAVKPKFNLYFNFLPIVCFIIGLISFGYAESTSGIIKSDHLPDDALKSDIMVVMTFNNGEIEVIRNKIQKKFTDSLLNYGFNIVYTYNMVMGKSAKPADQEAVGKLNYKYIFTYVSLEQGCSVAFMTNPKSGNHFQKGYVLNPSLDKILSKIKSDVDILKSKIKDADDNYKDKYVSDKKEEFFEDAPLDLKNSKLAVVLFDSTSKYEVYGITEEYLKKSEKILEVMKGFPYAYEIVQAKDFINNKNLYNYALMFDAGKSYKTSFNPNTNVYSNKKILEYYLYIVNSSDATIKYYINDKWTSKNDLLKVYKNFVKSFSK